MGAFAASVRKIASGSAKNAAKSAASMQVKHASESCAHCRFRQYWIMQSTPLALRKGVGQERQHDKVFSKRVLIFSFFTFEFFIFRLTFFPCAMSHQCWKRDKNSDTGQPSHLYQYLESDDSRSLQALDMLLFVTQVAYRQAGSQQG